MKVVVAVAFHQPLTDITTGLCVGFVYCPGSLCLFIVLVLCVCLLSWFSVLVYCPGSLCLFIVLILCTCLLSWVSVFFCFFLLYWVFVLVSFPGSLCALTWFSVGLLFYCPGSVCLFIVLVLCVSYCPGSLCFLNVQDLCVWLMSWFCVHACCPGSLRLFIVFVLCACLLSLFPVLSVRACVRVCVCVLSLIHI